MFLCKHKTIHDIGFSLSPITDKCLCQPLGITGCVIKHFEMGVCVCVPRFSWMCLRIRIRIWETRNLIPLLFQLNRRTLSRLNVAQLQLIQNDYLAQIETLNEELVGLLVTRDELGMEQDAMLTDIEDLSEFINIEKA